MKHTNKASKAILVVLVGLAMIIDSNRTFAQQANYSFSTPSDNAGTIWTKYESNPVISQGPPGSWDSVSIGNGQVIYDGQTYRIWYSGNNGVIDQIGLATSLDGKNWTKYSGNPVFTVGSSNDWDSKLVIDAFVMLDNGTYKMWYTGGNGNFNDFHIGYATSSDGITWTKYAGNPVLTKSATGWENASVAGAFVVKRDNTYHMWYSGKKSEQSAPFPHWAGGYATSSDGITWTKYAGNPVIEPTDSWETQPLVGDGLANTNVLFDGTFYRMYYHAGHGIGLAYSTDGINWTKYAGNPILTAANSGWESLGWVLQPFVINDGTELKMIYRSWVGDYPYYIFQLGLATSSAWPLQNLPPNVGTITAPTDPILVNTQVNTSAFFIDPDVSDTHTAVWDWGDTTTSSGTVNETNGSGTVIGSHTYTTSGVYEVNVTVIDEWSASDDETYQYVVVYNNSTNGGFVTGAGVIDSPAGAYTPNPTLAGIARFGFVSKYQPGTNTPTGNTEFRFQTAGFTFTSTDYQWLVVAGPQAKFKGTGTVNGSGNFGFLLYATDGAINGGGGVDKFRIKIWDKDNNDTVVYDNQLGAEDNANPTTQITGGNIVIH